MAGVYFSQKLTVWKPQRRPKDFTLDIFFISAPIPELSPYLGRINYSYSKEYNSS
jgi:hypothetical protein